jgi:hypothetical protein
MQDGIAHTATLPIARAKGSKQAQEERCGNAGAMESLEIQKQDFHPFHSSLEISHEQRDSHIPTARAVSIGNRENRETGKKCGPWKSGNPKTGFPLSHRPDSLRRKEPNQLRPNSERAERMRSLMPARVSFHAHPALETNSRFMLILRLENAPVS